MKVSPRYSALPVSWEPRGREPSTVPLISLCATMSGNDAFSLPHTDIRAWANALDK